MLGIIGPNGFVGSNVCEALKCEDIVLINKSNIDLCSSYDYSTLFICAGEARKWYVNCNVKEATQGMVNLYASISRYRAKKVVYFSSIDVYNKDYTENDGYSTEPYGVTKLVLEELITNIFENCVIVRLGALFGKGLKKNFLFDLLNERTEWIEKQSPLSGFQYFNMSQIKVVLDYVEEIQGQLIVDAFSEVVYNQEILNYLKLDYSLKGKNPFIYNIPYIDDHIVIRPSKNEILKQINEWYDEFSL
jgi:nucleoside-diphosphate-sugar epimerase